MNKLKKIKEELVKGKKSVNIDLLRKNKSFQTTFQATMTEEGIEVTNLRSQNLLPWAVFEKAIELLKEEKKKGNDRVFKGNAMKWKLGDELLPLDSIEGYVAKEVYKKQIGNSVFRRISPIVGILRWAGICENDKTYLVLK